MVCRTSSAVERRTENPCVPSSTLGSGTIRKTKNHQSCWDHSSAVEQATHNRLVIGSNPIGPTKTTKLNLYAIINIWLREFNFMKIDQKIKAYKLRKQKRSYSEIAKLLAVSKSTVSYWFKEIDWSKNIKKQLTEKAQQVSRERLERLNELKKKKWKKIYDDAEKEATTEFYKLKNDVLFIAGLSLYWGEGDKSFNNGQVRVSNVEYKLLHVFKDFLQKFCNIDSKRIRAYVILYPDLDGNKCLKYWSENVGIDKKNFYKSTVILGKHKKRRLGYGTCTVQVSSKYLKKKILVWIDLLSKSF
jgi:hypothetical protein